MDEYDEYEYSYNGYGYEQEQEEASLLTTAHHAGHNQAAMTQPTGQQATDLNLCYALDCNSKSDDDNDDDNDDDDKVDDEGQPKQATLQTVSASKSEHRLAIDFDLINATSSQVLQNCRTFNDLSLLDVEQQVEPFT